MADYFLDRLRILVVDDSQFVRQVLDNLLRTIGVGDVIAMEDGLAAIKLLSTRLNRMPPSVDIVITDVRMPSVDGLTFAKWLRQSKESPNRFLPVIMMSGAADDGTVAGARDNGANEFLAKPFSSKSVTDRLFAVIDRPRQFVATQDYFGPDRKRRTDEEVLIDKRRNDDDNANIVYSANRVVRPKDPQDIYFFRLPNTLQEKVGGGFNTLGSVPDKLLEEADDVLNITSVDFHDWAIDYLKRIARACREAWKTPDPERTAMYREVNDMAHELRGQGGMFGYPLITEVGEMLFGITEPPFEMSDRSLQLISAHVNLMQRVFLDRIGGDGGEIGQQLIAELRTKAEAVLGEKPVRKKKAAAPEEAKSGMLRPDAE